MQKKTKVQAIEELLKDNGGNASWPEIYAKIETYYPAAKVSEHWQAGIRGVVYREERAGKTFTVEKGKGIVRLKSRKYRVQYGDQEVIINGARDAKHALVIAMGDYHTFNREIFFRPDAIVEEMA